jgi:type I restriction enzyme M protein
LDQQVLERYPTLGEDEIKVIVVDDKWFASIKRAIHEEVQRLTQQLAGRIAELEARYAQPMPELERDVERISRRVGDHLKKMGLAWA